MTTATAPAQQLTIRERTGALIETVRNEQFAATLKALLGNDVPVVKFQQVVALALQTNPDLVTKADKSSLLLACQQAAKSKLLPDGKQGALVLYGNQVQWQVMIAGLRILLARHGFDLRTEIVYENDEFDYDLGDVPHITHKRPKLGVKRGNMIGAYAIARGPDGQLYRRVMDKEAIDFVRSKAKTGNVWSTWYDAMAEKTVGRSLVKQLPLYDEDELLREAIDNDNAQFDVGRVVPQPSAAATAVQNAVRGIEAPKPEAACDDVIDSTATDVTDEVPAAGEVDPLA